jgi:triosephosphate isomerase
MRQPLMAANWKMQKTRGEALAFVEQLLPLIGELNDEGAEVVIAPPFTALDSLSAALGGSGISWAAQNVHPEPKGAFTGEISVEMLVDLGCRYTLVGHSERRELFGENGEFVASKARALQAAGIRPIVCLGESLAERDAGRTLAVIEASLAESLSGVEPGADGLALAIAYEPIWAIGTGRTATPEMAQEVHAFIRQQLRKLYGGVAESIRIQYGGSVKPENVADLMAQPDIDGALVGGASLQADSFSKIVRFDALETP